MPSKDIWGFIRVFALYSFPGSGELRDPTVSKVSVFIALLSFITDKPSSEGPLSFSLRIIGSWEEQKAGGFSGAPLITKERQLAVKPTESVS